MGYDMPTKGSDDAELNLMEGGMWRQISLLGGQVERR